MIAFRLAFKNLIGAGLRTWLNVSVLSFAFVIIIFYNGLIDGWNRLSKVETKEWETGAGQFWLPGYDRYDPLTFQDSHAPLSEEIKKEVANKDLVPILITQASAFPQGRMETVILKGIEADQTLLKLPTNKLKPSGDTDYAIIGQRMAESAKLKEGDRLLIRWRDKNGTFDAREIEIASIFKSEIPTIDKGQIYLRLDVLQRMLGTENEATILVSDLNDSMKQFQGWIFRSEDFLLSDINKIIRAKKVSGSIMEGLLLIIALIAIFDTQVLSIFRRQKEIGTYIALGMTRKQVVGIFTVEGGAHSILATLLGALWGFPLFYFLNKAGIPFKAAQMTDLPGADRIFPYYSIALILITVMIVIITSTIVSYIPARKISALKPTDALKGKIS